MELFLVILGFLLLVVGFFGAIVPILPGLPLSFIGLLLLRWSGYAAFSNIFLWVWAGITVVITVMDYFLPSLMAKQFGGSRAASIGSFIGLVAGLFILPPWGMIAGPFLGALAGELIHNKANGPQALKVALGAFLAFIVGTGAKLIASAIMIFYAVKAVF